MRFVLAAILLTTLARPQDAPQRDLATLLPRGTSIFVDSEGLSDAAARLKGSALFAGVEGEARAKLDAVLGELAAMKVSRAAVGVLPAVIFQTRWIVIAESAAPGAMLATVEKWRKQGKEGKEEGPKPATSELPPFTVIADSADTIESVVALHAGKEKSLAEREDFRSFRARYPKGATRFHLQVDKLAPKMVRFGLDAKNDAGAVLFFSHVLHALKTIRVVSGATDLEGGINFSLSGDVDPMPESRALADSRPSQPVLTLPEDAVLRVSLARNLKKFWDGRGTLLSDAARAPLAEFQNNLSILMGGLSVEDVFAGLGTAFDLYVGRGLPGAPEGRRYPSAALVAVIADPALKAEFLLSFQTTMGIVNTQRAQESQPRFFQESASHRDVLIACARILPESVADKNDDRLQLEPALATVGDRLILGTNRAIVASLVDQFLDGRFQPRTAGDDAELSGPGAARALADVSAWLRSRMLLKEGTTDEAAGKMLAAVGAILGKVDKARARLEVGPKVATLDIRVEARRLLDPAPESR